MYPTSKGVVRHLATINPDERALLDEAAFAGLADGIRATVAAHPDLAEHFTLPGGQPVLLHLTETVDPHQSPASRPPGISDDDLALRISLDEEAARIDLVLDPPFLARFTEDGHRILGLVLHHTIDRVRSAHGGEHLVDAAEFNAAWDAAIPVLTWYGSAPYAPPPAPPHYLPSTTPHARARALRTAADAVRAASVPAGTFTGPDTVRHDGPAAQLLNALEHALADQIRSHHLGLVPALVRHLNAALAARAFGRREAVTGLSRNTGTIWEDEARHREATGAVSTTALQLLIQQALFTAPAGDRPADLIALTDLTALAELLLRTALIAIPASRQLHPVSGYWLTYTGRYRLKYKDPDVSTEPQEVGGGAAR
ncbi:hypothetical protein ACWCQP_37405 [Streptomyces chartreusis]